MLAVLIYYKLTLSFLIKFWYGGFLFRKEEKTSR